MKKIFAILFIIIFMISFSFVSFADAVQSQITKPQIRSCDALYCTPGFLILFTALIDGSSTYSTSSPEITKPIIEYNCAANPNNLNQITFTATASGVVNVPVVVQTYNLTTGSYRSGTVVNVSNTSVSLISWSKPTAYYSENINISSNASDISLLGVTWAEDNTYHTDFDNIEALLSDIQYSNRTLMTESSTFYNAVMAFYADFFSTAFADYGWYHFAHKFDEFAHNFYSHSQNTSIDLSTIIDLLEGDENSPTYESDELTSAKNTISEYESLEDQYLVDVSPGVELEVSEVLGNNGGFNKAGEALEFIRISLNDLISSNSSLYALMVTVLLFGVIILILGRRVSL